MNTTIEAIETLKDIREILNEYYYNNASNEQTILEINNIVPEYETNAQHYCTIKLKHAHGYQCPECYRITK